ncbi:MAG: thioredoxin family protein [Syntrophobacteraceae bacterium]
MSTSARVAQAFESEGYKDVYVLKGGWMDWYMNKFPVEKKDGLGGNRPPAGPERELLGKITLDQLYKGGPEYKQDMDAYPANPEIVGEISKIDRKTQVYAFIGWWCPDSAKEAPKMLKSLNAAANPNLAVEVYSVDRQLKDGGAGMASKFKLERVPTFVFMRNDAEIGRIVEYPAKSMEEDILKILKSGR